MYVSRYTKFSMGMYAVGGNSEAARMMGIDVDLIKIITGVRRSGKSVLMDTIKNELTTRGISGSHIISINLEDLDYSFIVDINDLHSEIKNLIIDDEKYYIFIDEIQHLENFEKLLASLRAKFNCSIFVTGSDSTLLSGDLATILTGRTVEFEIFPFSFKEAVDFLKLNNFIILLFNSSIPLSCRAFICKYSSFNKETSSLFSKSILFIKIMCFLLRIMFNKLRSSSVSGS